MPDALASMGGEHSVLPSLNSAVAERLSFSAEAARVEPAFIPLTAEATNIFRSAKEIPHADLPAILPNLDETAVAHHAGMISSEATSERTDYPVEFYSALFRGMTDVNGQVIGKFRDEAEEGNYHPLDGIETDGFLQRLVVRLAASGEFVGAESMIGEADHPRARGRLASGFEYAIADRGAIFPARS